MKRISKIAYAALTINMIIGVINIWRYEPYTASEMRTLSATIATLLILVWMAVTTYLLIKEAYKIAKKEIDHYLDKRIEEKMGAYILQQAVIKETIRKKIAQGSTGSDKQ